MRIALSFAASVLLASRTAGAVGVPTIYDNERVLPLGGRAAGMAGAYTALACDEAAVHYNLAALGCAGASRLEVSGSAYVLQHLSVPRAFGAQQDLGTTSFHSIPTIVGGVRLLAEGDPKTGVGQWALGFGVEVPRSLSYKASPARPEEPNAITAEVRDVLTRADIGVGAQLHRAWAVGVGAGASLRTYEASFSRLVVARGQVDCGPLGAAECTEFDFSQRDEEALALGLHAKLGIRFAPDRGWSFGLTVESPSVDLYGHYLARRTETFAVDAVDGAGNAGSSFAPIVSRVEGNSRLELPLRFALGAAYSGTWYTLSADLSLALPRDVHFAVDTAPVQGRGAAFVQLSADQTLNRTFQPNAALGAEVEVAEGTVVDFGAFTDLSSVADEDVATGLADRVHMFGGTLALGLLGTHARGWFGAAFQYGRAETRVLEGELDVQTLATGDATSDGTGRITRWSLSGFLGSSYSFFSEEDDPPNRGRSHRTPVRGGDRQSPVVDQEN